MTLGTVGSETGDERLDRAVARADVVQVARLPFLAGDGGANPAHRLQFSSCEVEDTAPLLASTHYLGPIGTDRYTLAGWVDDVMVACQVWRWPTARMVPKDWLELARWCLTPEAGTNAGSMMMAWARRWLRRTAPDLRMLVSYSDPSHGHTGALYKASGWTYSPTHHGERYDRDGIGYPSGHGSWDGLTVQAPKHRWTMRLKADA